MAASFCQKVVSVSCDAPSTIRAVEIERVREASEPGQPTTGFGPKVSKSEREILRSSIDRGVVKKPARS